ncbi:RHS repeat-associated core domain-containing protein [Chitinophaga sp. YIM B06452]|uniref:RHS repeat-associated core domain-containing protein n=1 Tax=Chitinophaga sp. YIM B06452 TaxID=3082158 RepID=UPI0031FED1CD
MPWNTKFITKLYTTFILLLLCCNAYGAIEPYQQQLKGRIRNGDTLVLRDEKFRNAAYNWSLIVNRKVSNRITFSLLMDSVNRIRKPFTAKLDMKVEYWSQPDQADPVTEDHITLNLKYDTAYGAIITPQDVHRFLNGHRVKITVNSITSPELGEDIPGIFALTNQVYIDRAYLPDPNAPAGQIFVTPTGQQSGGGGIQLHKVVLNWNVIGNAEEYDLEWTFVDEHSANGTLLSNSANHTPANLAKIFRNNATRVTLEQHSYTINLVHYSKYLLVRLRGVTTNTEGIRIEEPWLYQLTYNDPGQSPVTLTGVVTLSNTWHHPDMNWQYNATYAEDGKRKEVVTYFDKSLKSRQAVTLTNNSDNLTSEDKVNVVAQSIIYDQYGRPAVNVLPAPLDAKVLNYYPGLNKKTDGTAYTFMDVNPGGKLCNFTFPQMGDTSGASKYYSPGNPFLAETQHRFVPDAEGYPFSGQFYTNDNTGRISVQGGVGKVFQPNADPSFVTTHATRYYYSKPTQRELYKMFGNDVGDASHYSKTTTIDPNGQIAISYQNLSGKTIATALSGAAPDKVDVLPGVSQRTDKTFTLFNSTAFTFDPAKLTLSANQVYIVQEAGEVKFDIDIPRILARYAESGLNICTECAYEGVLTISSDCMAADLPKPIAINGAAPSTTCVTLNPAVAHDELTTMFDRTGAYYISLELRLKEKVITQAAEQFIALNTNLKKQFDFVIAQLKATDFGGCFDDCKTCYTALGVKANFIQRIKERLTSLGVNVTADTAAIDAWAGPLYDQLNTACAASRANCSDDPCKMLKDQLLADVSPYGQYALFDQNGLPLERDINIIFQKWRTVFPIIARGETGYDANFVQLGEGRELSVHDASFTLQNLVASWKPEWADKFIQYHPEYCGLQICERNSAYLKWDERLKSLAVKAADIPVVLPNKQYDPNAPAWLASADPYFQAGGQGNAYATAFTADLQNYSVNVKKVSGKSNKSITQFVDFMLYCSVAGDSTNASTSDETWTDCTPKAGCRVIDREWQLYLQYYMELKQFYYQKDRNENECVNKCKVGPPASLSGCPATNAFSLRSGTVTGTSQQLIIRHEGGKLPKATTVELFYPAEYNGLTQVASVSFAAGESEKTVTIHSGIPVSSVGVKNVTCVPGTVTYVCNGSSHVLELGNSVRKAGPYTWEMVTTSGQLQTYYVKEGYADELPATPAGCAGAVKTFYNCLRVKYNNNGDGEYFQNVWLITCGPAACTSSQSYTATAMYTSNRFGITGAEIEIIPFTVQNNSLTSTRCVNAIKSWYSCLTVNYNGTVYTYRNATVFECPEGSSGCNYIPVNYSEKLAENVYYDGTNRYVINGTSDETECHTQQFPTPACVKFISSVTGEITYYENVDVMTCSGRGNYNYMMSPQDFGVMSVPDPGFNQSINFSCAGMGRIAYQQYNTTGRVYWKAGYTGADIIPGGYVSAVFMVSYVKNGIQEVEYFPVTFNSSNMTQIQEFGVFVAASDVAGLTVTIKNQDCYAGNTATGCPEGYKTKQPRLVHIDYSNVGVADLQAIAQGQIQAATQSACINQADSWMRQMEEGLAAYTQGQRDTLKNRLIELCSKGIDIKHPNGASTLPPGINLPGGARSFKDVMKQVLGTSSLNMNCNPWLIDAPYPYKAPIQTNSPVISNSDPGICAELDTLRQEYAANGSGTFPQYLRTRFGGAMNLTDAEVNDLIRSCGACKSLLSANIELPVFLNANSKGCITAAELNAALTALKGEGITNFDSTHRNYERIVSNYFNHRWGFTLGYPAYKKLLDAFATNPSQLLCNEPLFAGKPEDPYDCLLAQVNHAARNGMMEYDKYIAEAKRKFRQDYIAACSQTKPSLKLTAKEGDYHYTLYYYDQAGQLVKTVPPAGVQLLTDAQIAAVETAGTLAACNYTGPTTETPISTTNSYVNTALTSGSRSMEMWLYQPSLPQGQLLFTTGTGGYLLSACMGGEYMELDIYKLAPETGNGVGFISSRHFRVKYVSPAELNWLHLVIQGADLGTGTGNLDIYVNGSKATANTGGAVPNTCGWEVGFVNGTLVLPSNTATLKHIRGYSRLLTQAEITAQYGEACLGVSALLASTPRDHWGRHNIPAPGGPTTVGGGTNETKQSPIYPAHFLSSTYSFTSLGGVSRQHTPDAKESRFWYDRLGRLVASRNANQIDRTSYTVYDDQGRITEVGERTAGGWTNTFLDQGQVNAYLATASGTRKHITTTLYDQAYNLAYPQETVQLPQAHLRKRVSASFTQETPQSGRILTAYSYDMLGNAATVYQFIDGALGLKQLDYKYDLASGKVNAVRYKTGDGNNEFFYNYQYDAENRLVKALSGIEAIGKDWEIQGPVTTDAQYYYYRHGPLARMELGKNKVQGIDYAYTLQGWLKMLNGQRLDETGANPSRDMGSDGHSGVNAVVGKDVYAYTLDYHSDDYKAAASGFPLLTWNYGAGSVASRELYNGNIARSTVSLAFNQNGTANPMVGYTYRYDQLNRLKNLTHFANLVTSPSTESPLYAEAITYDPNGNIKTYKRRGNQAGGKEQMDDLSYQYKLNPQGFLVNNQLTQVTDAVEAGRYTMDVDHQLLNNYGYDSIGNLVRDNAEKIGNISWTVYGKIASIQKDNGQISYRYDAAGNRVYKESTIGGGLQKTWYVRDAQGNTLAVYNESGSNGITWEEQHLYGSSRLGYWQIGLPKANSIVSAWNTEGGRLYELSNHLGNVMAVVSDKAPDSAKNAEIRRLQDYYAFGMGMPGRSVIFGGSSYRYGFNGKENDNEVKGEGNQQDYGMRIYDPRIGKFLSVDPITAQYPMLTPYQFASNTPLQAIDLDGLEAHYINPDGTESLPSDALRHRIPNGAIVPGSRVGPNGGRGLNEMTAGIVVITADIVLFKGALSKLFFFSQAAGIVEHNPAKSPEGKVLQEERFKNGITDLAIGYGAGKVIGGAVKAGGYALNRLARARLNFANNFYRKAGFAEEKIGSHVAGIDLGKGVSEVTYAKGTKLEQWTYLDETGAPKLGNYYTLPGADPTKLGIPLEGRVKTVVTLTEDTRFLKSTTADIENWTKPGEILKGGETQLFQTNVKVEIQK